MALLGDERLSENPSSVAAWLGDSGTTLLDPYVAETYDEDGEALLSPFAVAFGLGWIDADRIEAVSSEEPQPISQLLQGASYLDSFEEQLIGAASAVGLQQARSAVLLYGYEADPSVSEADGLRFVGNHLLQPPMPTPL